MKNHVAVVTFLLVLFICASPSYSKENYLKGIVITNDLDTITGFVDYQNWVKNPMHVDFKINLTDKPQRYLPVDIKGFHVKDERYEGAIVDVDISSTKIGELSDSPELILKNDTIFLQTVIGGDKSLYQYVDSYSKEHFFIKEENKFELLTFKKYLKINESSSTLTFNRKFVGQLYSYLNDCKTLRRSLRGVQYNKKSLGNLFVNYYGCTKTTSQFENIKDKAIVDIGVFSGVSFTQLSFKNGGKARWVDAVFSNSTNLSAGLFLDFLLSGHEGNWSIYNELMYSAYKVDGSYTDFDNEEKYTTFSSTLGYSYLKMNNMIRYKLPIGKSFFFLNAGISNGIAFQETNYVKKDIRLYSTKTIEEGIAIDDSRKYEQGLVAGLGSKIGKLSIEVRLEKGNGMTRTAATQANIDRYFLLVGYRF